MARWVGDGVRGWARQCNVEGSKTGKAKLKCVVESLIVHTTQ